MTGDSLLPVMPDLIGDSSYPVILGQATARPEDPVKKEVIIFLDLRVKPEDDRREVKPRVGDYYDFDDKIQILTGRATGHTYRIGDCVRAVLKECVPITGGLLFSIVGTKSNQKKHTGKNKRKKK